MTSVGSWLNEQGFAYEEFQKAREDFLKVYTPLTDSKYQKMKVSDPNGEGCMYHVKGEDEEFVITQRNITGCMGVLDKKTEYLKRETRNPSQQMMNTYITVKNELKTMKKLEEDLHEN